MSGDHNEYQKPYSYLDFECPRCGHCCKTDLARVGEVGVWGDNEPVAWIHNFIEGGISIGKKPTDLNRHPDRWTALYKDPTPCKTCQVLAMAVMNDQTYHEKVTPKQWVGLTKREVELIDEMIETQLLHAERCDHMANSTMAQKQKAWDLERVELLRKLKEKNNG